MSKTSFTAAILVLAAVATPSALAIDVFGALEYAEVYVEGQYEETLTQDEGAGEAEPEERGSEPSTTPPSDAVRVSALDVVVVSVPLPVAIPDVVPELVATLPLPEVVTLVDEAFPAEAPAQAPAPASAPSRSSTFVPLVVPDEPTVPATVVVAGAATVAAAGAATAGAGNTLWERLRRLGFLALLYSRIAKERLLDHGTRERLLETIRARPGLAVADLSELNGVPRNTVTYHLRVLERESLVSSQRQGRNRLFFAPGSLPQRQNADALATLRHETTLRMAQVIGASPGVDQKALCAQVGVSPSLAHWHADRLVASGVVDKRRDGRSVRYYPGTAFTVVESRSA